ncbi:MAG TPA: hypothetical protein VGF38_15360 [Ktedonobacterales bacterium]
MHPHIQLIPHLSCEEFESRARSVTKPHEQRWWRVLCLLAHDQLAKQVAQQTGYSPYWIGQIAKRYNRDGPAGMRSRARASVWLPSVLTSAQKEELRQLLRGTPPDGQPRWTGKLVATWMSEQVGRPITSKLGWNYLQRLGDSSRTTLISGELSTAKANGLTSLA